MMFAHTWAMEGMGIVVMGAMVMVFPSALLVESPVLIVVGVL